MSAARKNVTLQDLTVDVTTRSDEILIKLSGEVDYGNVARLRSALAEHAAAGATVVVDVSRVQFVDSMALSVLVQGKRRVDGGGGNLRVENPCPSVLRVLEVSGIADYLMS